MKIYKNLFEKIISPENLFLAWDKFKRGKSNRLDVLRFEWNLEQNIFTLHRELKNQTYKHAPYTDFYIHDPKRRHIHKAVVRDRVLHHAIFNIFNPIFEETFINNSFSCRKGKGTHEGVFTLAKTLRKVSKNYKKPCYALKCDVEKFFDSVDHQILKEVVKKRVKDKDALWLSCEIIDSYASKNPRERERELLVCRSEISHPSFLPIFT